MFIWGKLLGLIFGYWIAGFWGAILGCWIGHQFDNAVTRTTGTHHSFDFQARNQRQVKQIVFEATFATMGYLAKADGRVSERSIQCALQVMQQMGLTASQRQSAIKLFNSGKAQDFDLDTILRKLLQAGQAHPLIMQQFVELQLKVVRAADYQVSANKRKILEYIAQRLGLVLFSTAYQDFTEDRFQSGTRNNSAIKAKGMAAAYAELGVAATASDQEVKTAYRRLMSRHHPDKLASQGKAALLKAATQKTQQIKEAYELIKKARGMM